MVGHSSQFRQKSLYKGCVLNHSIDLTSKVLGRHVITAIYCLASLKILARCWRRWCTLHLFTFSRNARPLFINFGKELIWATLPGENLIQTLVSELVGSTGSRCHRSGRRWTMSRKIHRLSEKETKNQVLNDTKMVVSEWFRLLTAFSKTISGLRKWTSKF